MPLPPSDPARATDGPVTRLKILLADCRYGLDRQKDNRYLLDMSNAPRPAAPVLALDADGEEFALDFGYPAVSTARVLVPARDADTTDGRARLDERKGRDAAWRAANLIPAAKPR